MANEMMAGSDKAMTAKDLKPRVDDLEQMIMMAGEAGPGAEGEEMAETETVEAEAPPEMPEEMAAADAGAMSEDAQVIAQALDIEVAQAQALLDAAQQMAKTRGKSGKELADMMAKDFQLRMELEKLAGDAADQMEMGMAEGMGGAMAPAMPAEMPAP